MKATENELRSLKIRIAHACEGKLLNYSEISRNCDVHPSQVSRICRGDFKTISHNVVQICTELGLDMTVGTLGADGDADWSKVEAGARRLWEKSGKNGDQLAKLFEVIEALGPAC